MMTRNRWWLTAILVGFVSGMLAMLPVDHAAGQSKGKKKDPANPPDVTGEKTRNDPLTGDVIVPGKPLLAVEYRGHTAGITAFDFTSDGKKLVTLSEDNTIQVWNAATREHLKTVRLPWIFGKSAQAKKKDPIAMPPSKGFKGPTPPQGQPEHLAEGMLPHAVSGFLFAVSPDAKMVAVAFPEHHWAGATGKKKHTITHPQPPPAVAPPPDTPGDKKNPVAPPGTKKKGPITSTTPGAADGNEGVLILVHLETGRIMHLSPTGPGVGNIVEPEFKSLAFSGNGDVLTAVVGGKLYYGSVKVIPYSLMVAWHDLNKLNDAGAFEPTASRNGVNHPNNLHPTGLQFAPGSVRLAACFALSAPIMVYDAGNRLARAVTFKLDDPSVSVDQLAWSPQGSRLAAAAGANGPVMIYTADGLLLRTATVPEDKAFKRLTRPGFRGENELLLAGELSKDKGSFLCVLGYDPKTKRFDEIMRLPGEEKLKEIKISPDGQRLAILSGRARDDLVLVDLEKDAKPKHLYAIPPAPYVAFSKQGNKFAWTGDDQTKLIAGIDLDTAETLPAEMLKAEDFGPIANKASSGGYAAAPRYAKGGGLIDISLGTKIILTAYVAGQDWVVCTPQGYYAATPGGEQKVGWHVNNGLDHVANFYPLERFRKKLYRPDVIALVMENKGDFAKALRVANELRGSDAGIAQLDDQLPPRAVLTIVDQSNLPAVKLKVHATASSKKQPISALRLLVDGRPLPDGAAQEKFAEGKDAAELEWTVTLPPGKHELSALARCADSSAVSNVVALGVADPSKQAFLHVLAVGVNKYQDKSLTLDFAAKDAQDIAANFQKCCKGELYQDVHSEVLVDAAARKDAILKHLAEMRAKVKPNDLVVIYFAGHGVKEKDKFYLLPVESDTGNLAGTAISGDQLRKSLGEFPCQVLLLLDACHSSAGLKNFRPAVDDITRNLTDDDCGVAVLCAAMGHEKALEKDGNGLFTRAVVDGLNRGEGVPYNTSSRLFYVHHLHTYVFDRVSDLSGGRQHPFLSLPWVVESFPVAKFASK